MAFYSSECKMESRNPLSSTVGGKTNLNKRNLILSGSNWCHTMGFFSAIVYKLVSYNGNCNIFMRKIKKFGFFKCMKYELTFHFEGGLHYPLSHIFAHGLLTWEKVILMFF